MKEICLRTHDVYYPDVHCVACVLLKILLINELRKRTLFLKFWPH